MVADHESLMYRSHAVWMHLFERAGLKVLKQAEQMNFPEELFTVRM
jgi:hypothetical protein